MWARERMSNNSPHFLGNPIEQQRHSINPISNQSSMGITTKTSTPAGIFLDDPVKRQMPLSGSRHVPLPSIFRRFSSSTPGSCAPLPNPPSVVNTNSTLSNFSSSSHHPFQTADTATAANHCRLHDNARSDQRTGRADFSQLHGSIQHEHHSPISAVLGAPSTPDRHPHSINSTSGGFLRRNHHNQKQHWTCPHCSYFNEDLYRNICVLCGIESDTDNRSSSSPSAATTRTHSSQPGTTLKDSAPNANPQPTQHLQQQHAPQDDLVPFRPNQGTVHAEKSHSNQVSESTSHKERGVQPAFSFPPPPASVASHRYSARVANEFVASSDNELPVRDSKTLNGVTSESWQSSTRGPCGDIRGATQTPLPQRVARQITAPAVIVALAAHAAARDSIAYTSSTASVPVDVPYNHWSVFQPSQAQQTQMPPHQPSPTQESQQGLERPSNSLHSPVRPPQNMSSSLSKAPEFATPISSAPVVTYTGESGVVGYSSSAKLVGHQLSQVKDHFETYETAGSGSLQSVSPVRSGQDAWPVQLHAQQASIQQAANIANQLDNPQERQQQPSAEWRSSVGSSLTALEKKTDGPISPLVRNASSGSLARSSSLPLSQSHSQVHDRFDQSQPPAIVRLASSESISGPFPTLPPRRSAAALTNYDDVNTFQCHEATTLTPQRAKSSSTTHGALMHAQQPMASLSDKSVVDWTTITTPATATTTTAATNAQLYEWYSVPVGATTPFDDIANAANSILPHFAASGLPSSSPLPHHDNHRVVPSPSDPVSCTLAESSILQQQQQQQSGVPKVVEPALLDYYHYLPTSTITATKAMMQPNNMWQQQQSMQQQVGLNNQERRTVSPACVRDGNQIWMATTTSMSTSTKTVANIVPVVVTSVTVDESAVSCSASSSSSEVSITSPSRLCSTTLDVYQSTSFTQNMMSPQASVSQPHSSILSRNASMVHPFHYQDVINNATMTAATNRINDNPFDTVVG